MQLFITHRTGARRSCRSLLKVLAPGARLVPRPGTPRRTHCAVFGTQVPTGAQGMQSFEALDEGAAGVVLAATVSGKVWGFSLTYLLGQIAVQIVIVAAAASVTNVITFIFVPRVRARAHSATQLASSTGLAALFSKTSCAHLGWRASTSQSVWSLMTAVQVLCP